MTSSVVKFYDDLAQDYHLIFANWDSALERQSSILDKFIRSLLVDTGHKSLSLLDCSCGVGTQAIGLAQKGYEVTATDLSPASIQRAKREAELRGLNITFGVADFRSLRIDVPGEFDVVISADNAIPHLLTDCDLSLACENLYSKVRAGGLVVLTIRDYDALIGDRPHVTQPYVYDNGCRIVFQVWDWAADARTYTVNQFILQNLEGEWHTKHYSTIYRALLRNELTAFLYSSGFRDVKWHTPEESGYYQPIVIATKAW